MNIIFSDVDGTFKDLGKEIPKINIQAIQSLYEQGDRFVFVSGRNREQIQAVMDECQVPCDIIFSNGAGYQLYGEENVYRNALTREQFNYIVDVLEEHDVFYHIHTSTEVYVKPLSYYKKHLQRLRVYLESLGEQGKGMIDFKEQYFTEECVYVEDMKVFFQQHSDIKILKIEAMEEDEEKLLQLQEKFNQEGFLSFSSVITTLEITDPLSNKGEAIRQYTKAFPGATTYGIGDGENDTAMFEAVDMAIAVKNASETIQNRCQKVIGACDEGGVGHFIFDHIINTL